MERLGLDAARRHLPQLMEQAHETPLTHPVILARYTTPMAAITSVTHALPATALTSVVRLTADAAAFEMTQAEEDPVDLARNARAADAVFPPLSDDVVRLLQHFWDTSQDGQLLAELVAEAAAGFIAHPDVTGVSKAAAEALAAGSFATNLGVRRSEFADRVSGH